MDSNELSVFSQQERVNKRFKQYNFDENIIKFQENEAIHNNFLRRSTLSNSIEKNRYFKENLNNKELILKQVYINLFFIYNY